MQILECRDCVAAWQWPLQWQTEESIAYFEAQYAAQHGYYSPEYKAAVSHLRLDFLRNLTVVGRLLDIGAGSGAFVREAAKAGWDAIGLDVAGKNEDFASGGRVRRGSLECLDDELFDVVTLWDVVEHLVSPTSLLSDARDRLAPGGVLVLETGNYGSADRVKGGSRWWCYNSDHKWYFTPEVLMKHLEELGFTRFVHADRVFDPNWVGRAVYDGPPFVPYVKRSIKRPDKLLQTWTEYLELRNLATSRPQAGLGIFTIAAWR